jgi:stearoyl-CoA desaturase (delta-9 desaturase)
METKMKNLFNNNLSKNLQILTVSAYLITVVSIPFIQFSWSMIVLTTFMYFLIFGFGISLTFHRGIAHNALDIHPIVELVGKFVASIGGTGGPITWVLIHRAHHKYSDTNKDPHSSRDVLKYVVGKYPRVSARGIRKLAQSKFNKFMHRHYYLVILAYGSLWATLGIEYFCYGFVYPMVLNMVAGHLINWYTHSNYIFNYRLHNTKDTSQNNIVIGIVTWGEGYHNTHHRYPSRANFSMQWWEIDVTFIVIRLLERLNLVKANNV